jgi:histone acetyltransferase (RNA polymerase elongator complex component)
LLVIPVFIPHQGCPQNCIFCNQVSISGQESCLVDDDELVKTAVGTWLGRSRRRGSVQVAFFGGSFTCLAHDRQQSLLAAVQPFIDSGDVQSIRLSTRPDCIDDDICEFLKDHHVTIVELGVQSFDDKVLQTAWRGHSAADSIRAAKSIQSAGLELGIQLMPGLPQETSRSWFATLQQVCQLKPECVRIYPTLVIGGSGLANQFKDGNFSPISMNRAIALCGRAKVIFDSAGIKILRMGLQASESLEEQLLAGPYHPAFGEMVTARHWLKRSRKILADSPSQSRIVFTISDRDVSAFVGPKRCNMKRLGAFMQQDWNRNKSFKFETDATLARGTLKYVIA